MKSEKLAVELRNAPAKEERELRNSGTKFHCAGGGIGCSARENHCGGYKLIIKFNVKYSSWYIVLGHRARSRHILSLSESLHVQM